MTPSPSTAFASRWPDIRLRALPYPLRLFLTGFLLTLSLGYALGLTHVWEKTGMKASGIRDRYGAVETETHYPKSLGELLETTHNHTITFSFIFLALGTLFAFTPTPPRLKAALLVEPWIAIPLSMGSMFGTRYLSPHFGYLMFVASVATAATFAAMVLASLAALWLEWGPEA